MIKEWKEKNCESKVLIFFFSSGGLDTSRRTSARGGVSLASSCSRAFTVQVAVKMHT